MKIIQQKATRNWLLFVCIYMVIFFLSVCLTYPLFHEGSSGTPTYFSGRNPQPTDVSPRPVCPRTKGVWGFGGSAQMVGDEVPHVPIIIHSNPRPAGIIILLYGRAGPFHDLFIVIADIIRGFAIHDGLDAVSVPVIIIQPGHDLGVRSGFMDLGGRCSLRRSNLRKRTSNTEIILSSYQILLFVVMHSVLLALENTSKNLFMSKSLT